MTGVRHPPTRFDPNPRFQVAQQKMSSSANPFRCNSAKGEKPQLFESVNTKLSHQQKYRVDDYGIVLRRAVADTRRGLYWRRCNTAFRAIGKFSADHEGGRQISNRQRCRSATPDSARIRQRIRRESATPRGTVPPGRIGCCSNRRTRRRAAAAPPWCPARRSRRRAAPGFGRSGARSTGGAR